MYEAATSLHRFLTDASHFYVNLTPEIPDFTDNKDFTLSFHLPKKKLDITVNRDNVRDVCAAIQQFAFKSGNKVLCWNIKELFTYIKFYTKTSLPCEASILDLKLVESFMGVVKKAPENYISALNRAQAASKFQNWKRIYGKIFLPLTKEVIPSLEVTPLLNEQHGKLVYSHYEIDGQANGRSRCSTVYNKSYNPHTMGDEQKAVLRPRGYGRLFLYCDYNQMEVSVLQWLSKDPVLTSILESGKDFYKAIHMLLFGTPCQTDEDRSKCKLLFLPVVYGQSAGAIAGRFGISLDQAHAIIEKLRKVFSVAFNWIENRVGLDYFGRERDFSDGMYKARNFCVQSPASVFCLEKLIKLYDALQGQEAELAYHIHDGYGIICNKKNYIDVFAIAQQALESYSDLLPELSIRISGHIGMKLNKMMLLKDNK